MTTLADLIPAVAVEAPGCPDPTIERALLNAISEFCRDTHIWHVELDPIDTFADQASYWLPAPAGTSIAAVLEITHIDQPLRLVGPDAVRVLHGASWRDLTGPRATCAVIDDPSNVRLVPVPTETVVGGLRGIRVALQPVDASTELPDSLAMIYGEGVQSGALGRLLSMPGRDWFNPDLALYHQAKFRRAKGQAKADMLRAYAGADWVLPGRRLRGAP